MEKLSHNQINTINAALNAYPSTKCVQALSNMGAKIFSITQSLGKHARLGMTSVGMSTRRRLNMSLKNTFRCL